MTRGLLNDRNREAWQAAKEKDEALLVGYLVAGDPAREASLSMVRESVEAGIDVVELGVPGRRPEMDGPIIQRAHKRALDGGMSDEEELLAYWRAIRQQVAVPFWAMGYKSDVVGSGLYKKLIREQLVDALVLPDCTLEEQVAIQQYTADFGVDIVRFINSAMDEETMKRVCDGATIIYAQSYAGTTGDPLANVSDLSQLCSRIRHYLPEGMIVSGFGLRTPKLVGEAVRSGFDGAVVGSALVARCENQENDYLYRMVAEMKMQTVRSNREEESL
ncbi:tryptophan synthase subunit alpha [Paenibacillus sp. J5C_2022]|uniref:tryptophan synthase subunit alpha n=1 Tax=Paenibacillus sp. J5C2022 TaxID=2977129 RepID=UPI0021CFAADF|nr:tryptophan synthase subunit alpha [Paenibacillus sp. J5C2022]MCU6709573.1 tryptophan synthase subunit alpha [Paenibacillus sp. J5C2022]